MAQTGFTPIQLYRTTTASTAPSAGNLADGELAINVTDGRLFYKDNAGAVQTIGWKNVPVSAGGTGATTASAALTNLGAVAKAGDTMTGVLVVVGGTVSAPGIAFSGDTNTGIYSPAADTIAFTEGGTEVLRLDSSSNATFAGTAVMASSFLRNRIINGDMRIDQRNAGASVTLTAGGVYPVDRFVGFEDTDGVMTAQRSTTAPTGFVNSLQFTTTTADASLSSLQYAAVQQLIEGSNISDLGWGTASAQTVTLSFWVRSSLTGTFGGVLKNSAADRSYVFTYTISSANTWEQKAVVVPGDTSGTWLTTTGIGLRVTFGLGVGSGYSGAAGAWSASNLLSATGAVSVIGTLNATWFVTGVQLEVGTAATPFERRQFGQEFFLCQRYFTSLPSQILFTGYSSANDGFYNNAVLPVNMRATPSIVASNVFLLNANTFTVNAVTSSNLRMQATANPAGVAYVTYDVTLSAEL